jgi:hypothetical protein
MVCLAKKSQMLRSGLDFDKHTNEEHYFWKYAYYLGYLMNKKMVDMTGFEGVVWDNYKTKKTDWIPYFGREEIKEAGPSEMETEQKKISTDVTAIKDGLETKFEALEQKLASILDKLPKDAPAPQA